MFARIVIAVATIGRDDKGRSFIYHCLDLKHVLNLAANANSPVLLANVIVRKKKSPPNPPPIDPARSDVKPGQELRSTTSE